MPTTAPTSASTTTIKSLLSRTAVVRNDQSACSTIATTTGTNQRRMSAMVELVNTSSYIHTTAQTMTNAGMMNDTPPTTRPRQPARRAPSAIAISVEFGPGTKAQAPTMRANSSSLTHDRSATTRRRIMAMWAAGPPTPITPNHAKSRATSSSRRCGCGASNCISGGMVGNAMRMDFCS